MLNSKKLRIKNFFDENGAALIEYAVLLAFIAVIAVAFATDWNEDYDAFLSGSFKANNLATAVRKIIFNVYYLLTLARNTMP